MLTLYTGKRPIAILPLHTGEPLVTFFGPVARSFK